MKQLSWILALALTVLWSAAAFASGAPTTVGFASAGAITLNPQSSSASLEAQVSVECAWDDLVVSCSADVTGTTLDTLSLSSIAPLGSATLSAAVQFDEQTASTVSGNAGVATAFDEIGIDVETVFAPGAMGMGIEVRPQLGAIVERFAIGFNLSPFGTTQTESCSLNFTFIEIDFSFSGPPCADAITGSLLYEADGFTELYLSASQVGGLPIGVSFGASVLHEAEEKTLDLHPSLTVESPACLDVYAGLDWDDATRSLKGIKIYGLGARCEIGGVRFRGLWSLAPSEIALVKAPYWSLLGLVWTLSGCCDEEGEGSVAFFFGDENLFDIGEIEAAFMLPVSETSSVSLTAALKMGGGYTLTLGWDVEL